MLIDTHAHVNFRGFKDDAKEVLKRSMDQGVWVINIGSQIDTSRQAVELANMFEKGVYAAVGLHPEHTHSQHVDEEETHFLTREEHFDTSMYRSLAENPKVVGIGECGLDYYRLPVPDGPHQDGDHLESLDIIKEKQKQAFIAQINLAKELDKTLIIHSRSSKGTDDAAIDILEILKSEILNLKSDIRFVLHSYTGSPELMQEFYKLGGYISFNGIITFDKTGNMEKLVKQAPLDRFVLETDCPYLAPVPNRGKRNEPAYVKYVAQRVAEVLGLELAEVEKMTTENAKKLFLFPSP